MSKSRTNEAGTWLGTNPGRIVSDNTSCTLQLFIFELSIHFIQVRVHHGFGGIMQFDSKQRFGMAAVDPEPRAIDIPAGFGAQECNGVRDAGR